MSRIDEMRLQLFERWLSGAEPEPTFVYHRGDSLARGKQHDPGLAALADRVLRASDCDKPLISQCGHERGRVVGTGQVRLVTRRERGMVQYVAVRRAG